MSDIELTSAEEAAIKSLRSLMKKWPKSLILFGASGILTVRKGGTGMQYEVASIEGVHCDGGDGGDEF